MATLAPQDRWSQDKHIELVNIIGNLGAGMLTRAMAKQLSAASTHECLFVDFLSEEEPKKVSEALKHPGWTNPKESHLIAIKRIFRYLKGTPSLGLWYLKCLGFDLKGYSDSDFAGCNIDKKSTLAAVSCCANILWMKSQLTDYDIIYENIPIFCDNTSAIAISNNLFLHSRTKHIDIRYQFIRNHILKGDIELHFILTQYQLADIFTKPLDELTFKRLIVELGMLNIDSKPEASVLTEEN
nr:retrovirus-related Pol polyprotein from transposon TNT 1-94 [Tanacetum cinerariifolium]